jgi:hypothetical protein
MARSFRKKTNILCLVCSFFVLAACQSKTTTIEHQSTDHWHLDHTQTGPEMADHMYDISILHLNERDGAGIINDVDQILYEDHHYFVFDRKQSKILQFDLNGNYVNELHQQGKGPTEYHSISSVQLDHINGHWLIHDPYHQKIVWYDRQFKFIKSLGLKDMNIQYFHYFPQSHTLLLHFGNDITTYEGVEKRFSIGHFDADQLDSLGWYLPIEYGFLYKTFATSYYFSGDIHQPTFFRNFDPNIYQWVGDTQENPIRTIYPFTFNAGFIDPNGPIKDVNIITFVESILPSVNEIYGIQGIQQNEDFLFFRYLNGNRESKISNNVWIDKNTQQFVQPTNQDSILLFLNHRWPLENGYWGVEMSLQLLRFLKNHFQDREIPSILTLPNFDLEKDNIYLLKYRMKPFNQ